MALGQTLTDPRLATYFKLNRIDYVVIQSSTRKLLPRQRGKDLTILFNSDGTISRTDRLTTASLTDANGNYMYIRMTSPDVSINDETESTQMRAVVIVQSCSDINAYSVQFARWLASQQGITVISRSIDRERIYESEAPENARPLSDSVQLCIVDFNLTTFHDINCQFECGC